jgi:hypothetical protein
MIKNETNSNKDVFVLLGGVGDKILELGPEIIRHVFKILNEKRYRVSDTPLSYRQINYLDTNGILEDSRDNNKEWRKFSLKELLYLNLIKELRIYGLADEHLRKLKKVFFSKEYRVKSDFAIAAVLGGIKVILVLNNQASFIFYSLVNYKFLESEEKSHISINLNEVTMDIWEKLGGKRIEYFDEANLMSAIIADYKTSEKESELLKIIRNKEYKTITIRKNGEEVFIVKGEKAEITKEKKLIEMIKQKDFVDINIVKRNGNIVNIKIEDSFKIK